MKKFVCLFYLVFGLLFCSGATFDELSNDDAGQLLCRRGDGMVFVFRSCSGGKYWNCVPFKGNGSVRLRPRDCEVLDYAENTLLPESVAVEFVYWFCKSKGVQLNYQAKAFLFIAEKMNTPVTNSVLDFYSGCRKFLKQIRLKGVEHLRTKRNSGNPAQGNSGTALGILMSSGMQNVVKNTVLSKMIADKAAQEKNYFAAFCMYLKYRELAFFGGRLLNKDDRQQFAEEINDQGENIRVQFLQDRTANAKRENDFRALGVGKYGFWAYAPPGDLDGMCARVEKCFQAFKKMYSSSPYSEFPDWGNAALEVMQMMRISVFEQKFDAAFAEYQKSVKN